MANKICLDDDSDSFNFLNANAAVMDHSTDEKMHGIISFAPAVNGTLKYD
jgi:hypothetical protein